MSRQEFLLVLAVILCAVLGLSNGVMGQKIWYVDDNAPNDPGPGNPLVSDPSEMGTNLHPFDMIEEALIVVKNGDQIHVIGGTYVENLVWPQKNNITLWGVNGPEVTIIDGHGDTKSCIYVGNGQTGVVIKGITVSRGDGSPVTFNSSLLFGGGICIDENVIAVIDHCIIKNNGVMRTSGGGVGGGVFVSLGSDVTISNCLITKNRAEHGGGVYFRNLNSLGKIENCIITHHSDWLGISTNVSAVYCDSSPIIITNNTISYNDTDGLLFFPPWPRVTNNIISFNQGYAIVSEIAYADDDITYNNLWDNTLGDFIHILFSGNIPIVGKNGNISGNPLFVLEGQQPYQLKPGSAAIDVGNNSPPGGLPAKDLEGNPRLLDGDQDGLAIVDMGAIEMVPRLFKVPSGFSTIQGAIDTAVSNYNTIEVGPGSYFENINFKGKNIRVQSSDPEDPRVVAGTVIQGTGAGSVVVFGGSETGECQLSGFTIRGGNTDWAGGGILGNNTQATIDHCILTGNTSQMAGGGMWGVHGTISNCVVSYNHSNLTGGGLAKCDGLIVNCLIHGNTAVKGGGLNNCDGEIINCTVTGNSADGEGVIRSCDGSFVNDIVWGNSPAGLYDNTASYRYCCLEWSDTDISNISNNPLFLDTVGGDLHLKRHSPCIDEGDPLGDYGGQVDMEGGVRVRYGRVDMGAYEVFPIAGDFDVDEDVDLAGFINRWLEMGCGGPDWCGGADFDGNGRVEMGDWVIMGRHWLKK